MIRTIENMIRNAFTPASYIEVNILKKDLNRNTQ